MTDWMIYGATGYTGQLVAEEAIQRGHRPLLAGRSEGKLRPLAERLGLEYVVAPLDDAPALLRAVERVRLVYLAAGPFIHTSTAVVAACLQAGAHYLDITGEVAVYQSVFAQDAAARAKGVALVPGIGFDVVPSDCLAKHVADTLPDATEIVTVIDALGSGSAGGGISAGTAKTQLEMIRTSGFSRRENGRLVEFAPGSGARRFPMQGGERLAMPVPWGDIETVYRSTGIPNITSYITMPAATIRALRLTGGVLFPLLRVGAAHRLATALVERFVKGPSAETRHTGRTQVYAEARNARGDFQQAWLETLEAYQFTKVAGVRAVEHVLATGPIGALAPSQALGADFVLGIEGTRRWDTRPY